LELTKNSVKDRKISWETPKIILFQVGWNMLSHKIQCEIAFFGSFQNLTYILLMDINTMRQDLYFGKEIGQINYTEQKIYPPKPKFCFKLADSTVIMLIYKGWSGLTRNFWF
jgi:hypothetical protein